MPLDNANYISQMNLNNPVGTDWVSQTDDFFRELKRVVQQSFPNINAAAMITSEQLNNLSTYFIRGSNTWDVKNSSLINVISVDNDAAVQPRSYNDQRYLKTASNLSDVPNKTTAVANLFNSISTGSAAENSMRPIILNVVYPVGTIYTTTNGTNPTILWNFGTWEKYGQGRVLMGEGTGVDSRGESRAFGAGSTGGEYQHQLSVAEMPSHNHGVPLKGSDRSGNAAITSSADNNQPTVIQSNSAGGDQAHNNIQPYLVVYFWRRIA